MSVPIGGVHGIRNYGYLRRASGSLEGAVDAISADWATWLAQGVGRCYSHVAIPLRVPVAYYADCLFRGHRMGVDDPGQLNKHAQALFIAWVDELQREEAGADAASLVRQGRLTLAIRQPVAWFTERYGERALAIVTATVAELATYFDPEFAHLRNKARARVAEVIRRQRPRVLLAHSLGSVVAYEALCQDPDLNLEMLITLGSPLAMHSVVFERLQPKPIGRGMRPPGVASWVNIADYGDPVAVPRHRLAERFDGVDRDHETSISLVNPHTAQDYLGCAELAAELAPFLTLPPSGP